MSRLSKSVWAAALVLMPAPALAQGANPCMPRDAILAALEANFLELPVGIGLQNETAVVEFLLSSDGGSWTILRSFSNGISCVIASGTDWLSRKPMELAGIAS